MFENFYFFLIAISIMVVSLLCMPYFYNKGSKISPVLAAVRFFIAVVLTIGSYLIFVFFEVLRVLDLLQYESLFGIFILVGALIVLSGAFIMVYSIYYLKTIIIKPGKKLITGGPYKFRRHPVYFGAFICSIGCSVLAYSPLSLIYSIALIPILTYLYKKEEIELVKRFGKKYKEYQKKVPALF
jgi:protein-S-isoprenylcysteine O-methyltransferase Ste14